MLGTQGVSLVNDVLREDFLPDLREQFNSSSVLIDLFRQNRDGLGTRESNGEYYVVPLHVGGNESSGARVDGANLPPAGHQQYKQAKFYDCINYARFKISGPAVRKGKKAAVVNLLDMETKRCGKDLQRNVNRQLYGNADGLLAVCVSASDSTVDGASRTTLTLLYQGSSSAARAAETDTALWLGTQYLREGMPVSVLLRTTGNVNAVGVAGSDSSPVTIYKIDAAARTVVLSTTVAVAASIDTTYGVFSYGAWTATDGSGSCGEMYGLRSVMSTSNPTSSPGTNNRGTDPSGLYGAINRTTAGYSFWKGLVKTNPSSTGSLRPISLDLLQECVDDAEIASGNEPRIAVAHPAMHRKLAALCYPDRRYSGDSKVLNGGWKGFEFNDMTFVRDKDCPPHTIFFFDPTQFELFEGAPLGIIDEDGNTIRMSTDKDEFTGAYQYTAQLVCMQPNGQVQLKDLEM